MSHYFCLTALTALQTLVLSKVIGMVRLWIPAARRRWLVAGGLAAGSITAFYNYDSVNRAARFATHAAQRGTTVGVALGRCIWRYQKVINAKYPDKETERKAYHDCHVVCAEIARKAMEQNAGIWIKVGQHVCALNYIFPEEWTTAMIPLQDKCPVSSYDSVEQLFESDMGKRIDELFSEFDREPMGTASLAQVHRARLKDGQEVAVKVQHPSLDRYVPLDIMLVSTVTSLSEYFFPNYPLRWLSDELQNSIYVELDFREEAKNASRTADYFKQFYDRTALRVPDVYWSMRRLLCMEFLQGIRPDDLEALNKAGVDRGQLSMCFAHLFNNMIFTPGVGLHCDPHAGNIAIMPLKKPRGPGNHKFEVILYDHGLYRYIPTKTRLAYAHLWLSLIDKDEPGMKKWAYEFAGITDENFRIFAAAITGRDTDAALTNVVTQRDPSETEKMAKTIQDEGLIGEIMRMLRIMPNVTLLILKTNDLIRYLDYKLDSPLGIVRSFVIMAQYCANAVFADDRETLFARYGHTWSIESILGTISIYMSYWRRIAKLKFYDLAVRIGLA